MKNNEIIRFQYNDDGRLIVDAVWRDSHYPNNYIVMINGSAFLLSADRYYPDGHHVVKDLHHLKYYNFNPKNTCMTKLQQYVYIYTGCVPKEGFHVNVGRAITDAEFRQLIAKYNLTAEDISDRFEDVKGKIYGKYAKTYMCVQVRVENNQAIGLEMVLQSMGIEAGNIAPGRVNIRVE